MVISNYVRSNAGLADIHKQNGSETLSDIVSSGIRCSSSSNTRAVERASTTQCGLSLKAFSHHKSQSPRRRTEWTCFLSSPCNTFAHLYLRMHDNKIISLPTNAITQLSVFFCPFCFDPARWGGAFFLVVSPSVPMRHDGQSHHPISVHGSNQSKANAASLRNDGGFFIKGERERERAHGQKQSSAATATGISPLLRRTPTQRSHGGKGLRGNGTRGSANGYLHFRKCICKGGSFVAHAEFVPSKLSNSQLQCRGYVQYSYCNTNLSYDVTLPGAENMP